MKEPAAIQNADVSSVVSAAAAKWYSQPDQATSTMPSSPSAMPRICQITLGRSIGSD